MKTLRPLLVFLPTLLSVALVPSRAADAPYREPFAQSFPIREAQHLQLKTYVDKLLAAQADRILLMDNGTFIADAPPAPLSPPSTVARNFAHRLLSTESAP